MSRQPRLAALLVALLPALGCASSGPPRADATPVAAPEPTSTASESTPATQATPSVSPAGQIELVALPSPDSPLVAVRLLFRAGSIDDPPGKEGLAALTGLMMGQAGTARRSYSEVIEALYPMASGIVVRTDREVTLVGGQVPRAQAEEFAALLVEAVTTPGFVAADFERNRELLLAYLTTTLRAGSDELLGLELVQQRIFGDAHPYGHAPQGTVAALRALTVEDVRRFHAENFTRARLLLGVAGAYPEGFAERLRDQLATLAPGAPRSGTLPAPQQPQGRRFLLVDKPTSAVAIHFGHPLDVTPGDADYFPLLLANSYLGEHRTFFGVLQQELREKRGFNYGNYSYIEHWWNPPGTTRPSRNVPRRQQYFSVWLRPVPAEQAQFALRGAVHFVERLVADGIPAADFELTRDYLVNSSKLWAQTLWDRLGFALDARYYGSEPLIEAIEASLPGLTAEQVSAAVREHLHPESFEAVLVTPDAAAFAAALRADAPSPVEYASPKEPALLAVDAEIAKLPLQPAAVEIVPVGELFEQ